MADLLLTLTIRDLVHEDLPGPWAPYPGHVEAVRKTLDLVPSGTKECVTAALPSGVLVGKCAITYDEIPGAGVLMMIDVDETLRSCGIGSALIAECERRIQARGVLRAELAAETNNPRAQALYERLGYTVYAEQPGGWNHTHDDGTVEWYATTLVHLRKDLPASAHADLPLRLTIRDLRHEDLPGPWAPYPSHVEAVGRMLDRVPSGGTEYVTACLPSGLLIGKGAIDYEEQPGAGVFTQFDVHGTLQSCGIGSAMIAECERRIQARGVLRAELAVETINPRAQALYERLGYIVYAERPGGWDQQHPDGTVYRYETTLLHLRKELPG